MLTPEFESGEDSIDNVSTNYNSEWDKLLFLMWKNIRVLWSNREQFILIILMPIFFCALLVLLRISLHIDNQPVQKYPILELNDYWDKLMSLIDERKANLNERFLRNFSNPFIPEKVVGYAPDNLGYGNIMKDASDNLQSLVVNSYDTCDHLRSAIIRENLFAGVCFMPNHHGISEHDKMIGGLYPNFLKYHLIFPFACRMYLDTFIGNSWSTNALYHFINRTDQINIGEDDGGYVGYIREGFAPLQNAISLSYIKLVANVEMPNFKIPKVIMNRYPSKEFQKDDLVESVDFSLSLIIVLGSFYPVLMFIDRIVGEKERSLKRFTKIMGINSYVHCLGWMCNYLLSALISSFVIVVLLKINWSSGTSILNRSSFFALLLVISLYNITSICFVLMLSALFTQTYSAVSTAAVTWFVTYIPFIMSMTEDQDATWVLSFFKSIFHNTTLGFIIETILEFEIFGEGLTFENFFHTGPLRGEMSTGSLSCIMVIQCIIYILLNLYIEEIMPNMFESRKSWHYIFTLKKATVVKSQGPKKSPESDESQDSSQRESRQQGSSRPTPFIYQVGGGDNEVVVLLQDVCKAHKKQYVLKNINLQLSDNEVTILLGHNGSGKTTLLSIISGLTSITSGRIKIDGFDMISEARYAWASLGLCMGSTLLYPDLTVEDQIRYFSYLKGFRKDLVELELDHYLKAANLSDIRIQQTKDLPMGTLQRLAICCALVGQSRVVLLDDPTTHMNFATRTLIWKLLESEKLNRTILITSTSADILEGLGDRVAILNNGQLQCDGTPIFLKKMYGQGYRLVVKGPEYNVDRVTRKVREFIPNVTPICSLGNEINYDFQEADTNIFDQLTESLESSLTSLGIDSVTLRPVNIDDIFFKLAAANPGRENRTRLMEIMNGQSSYPKENKRLLFMEIKERVTGIRKTLQHFHAMWSQRITYAMHFKSHTIKRVIFAPIFVVMAFFVSAFSSNLSPMPLMNFSLEQYKSSVTLVDRRNGINKSDHIVARYSELIFWLGTKHRMEDTEGELLTEYYLNASINTLERLDQKHHIGVTFAVDYIIAWFNNVAVHSVPLSLNMVHNAILRTILGELCGIDISLEPLNNQRNYIDSQLRATISTSHVLTLCISMCVCCVWNTIIFIFVREVRSGNDKAQLLAGAKFLTYWLVNNSYITLTVVLASVLITLTIMLFQYRLYIEWHIYFWYTFVFILCGWWVCAFNNMIALFVVSPSHAFSLSLSIQAFGILCFCHVTEAFEKTYVATTKTPYVMYFMFLPMFAVCSAISTIYYNGEFQRICHDENIRFISIHLEHCEAIPNCCKTVTEFSVFDGVIMEVIAIVVSICICWWVILMYQFQYFYTCSKLPEDNYYAQLKDHQRRHDDTQEFELGEESAFLEQYEIQKMKNIQDTTIPLIIDRLGKNIGDKVAVDRMSLVLHRKNCFGILGVTGSGVTTLFNIITGGTAYSYGRILIKGHSAIHNSDLVQKFIGYGRQQMISFPELTMKNVLEHACKLRSYPPQNIKEICVNLAKVLGFFPYYHKKLSDLSFGLLNRLNCAVAVMGNPEIILLDMAIAGIDSAGKREVWNVLKRMQSKGATILVSTTSLRDCERYCNRVGFMSHGRLCLIGTPWNLKKLIADYYYLKVKTGSGVLPSARASVYITAASQNKLTDFVYRHFPNAILKQHRGNNFVFLLPVASNSITYIFRTLMRKAYYLNIEDFELNHSLLSESFIAFWEKEFGLQYPDDRSTIGSMI